MCGNKETLLCVCQNKRRARASGVTQLHTAVIPSHAHKKQENWGKKGCRSTMKPKNGNANRTKKGLQSQATKIILNTPERARVHVCGRPYFYICYSADTPGNSYTVVAHVDVQALLLHALSLSCDSLVTVMPHTHATHSPGDLAGGWGRL